MEKAMKPAAWFRVSPGIICLLPLLLSICSPLRSMAGPGAPVAEADTESGRRISERERRIERDKRLLVFTIEDLNVLQALAAKEIAELEREADAVKPFESPVRETDLRDLTGWYSDYSDWLQEKRAEFDGYLAALASGGTPVTESGWPKRYAEMAAAFKEFEKQVVERAKDFVREEKRLAQIVDRRRLLQGSLGILAERLDRIEKRLAERPREKGREDNEALSLRSEISVVQGELLTLPLVDEAILKHYANLGERARGEGEWLLAKSDEYDLMRDISRVIAGDKAGGRAVVEAALIRVQRVYERQIDRLQRRIDTIERKRSRVAPAGSLREMERSAELIEFYGDQKRRYEDYISRLKTRMGAWEAELSELLGR